MNEALTLSVRRHDGGTRARPIHAGGAARHCGAKDPAVHQPRGRSRTLGVLRPVDRHLGEHLVRAAHPDVAPADGRDDLDEFVSRLHGLSAAYYADQITAEDGKTNLRKLLLRAATPRIRAMADRKFASTARGLLTELVFVHRAQRQFHSAVYWREPTQADLMDPQRHGELVVPPREMNALVVNVLQNRYAQETLNASNRYSTGAIFASATSFTRHSAIPLNTAILISTAGFRPGVYAAF